MLQVTMTKERAVILLMIVVAAVLLVYAVLSTSRVGESRATITGTIGPAVVDDQEVGGHGLVGAVLWWPEAG